MRKIKFRAWDKNRDEMLNVLMGVCPDDAVPVNMISVDSLFEWNEIYVPLQYTGLKDKNGKEIYEGDILNCRIEPSGSKGVVGIVKYFENFWGFVVATPKDKCLARMRESFPPTVAEIKELLRGGIDGEVIGNIYENPELIKEKENG
jgi:uncharacterized phage protein (TIGR01671 family)